MIDEKEENMRDIQFFGQLTEDDYRAMNALASRKLWIISGVCMLALLIFNLWNSDLRQLLSNPLAIFLTLLPVVIIFPVLFITQRFAVRRHWRNNKVIQRSIKGRVSEKGIDWEIEDLLSTNMPWDLLLHYRESSDFLLVYQGINQVYYFFPRYFANESLWQEFRELVAEKLPRK